MPFVSHATEAIDEPFTTGRRESRNALSEVLAPTSKLTTNVGGSVVVVGVVVVVVCVDIVVVVPVVPVVVIVAGGRGWGVVEVVAEGRPLGSAVVAVVVGGAVVVAVVCVAVAVVPGAVAV